MTSRVTVRSTVAKQRNTTRHDTTRNGTTTQHPRPTDLQALRSGRSSMATIRSFSCVSRDSKTLVASVARPVASSTARETRAEHMSWRRRVAWLKRKGAAALICGMANDRDHRLRRRKRRMRRRRSEKTHSNFTFHFSLFTFQVYFKLEIKRLNFEGVCLSVQIARYLKFKI